MTAVRVFFNGRSEEELLKRRATGEKLTLSLDDALTRLTA